MLFHMALLHSSSFPPHSIGPLMQPHSNYDHALTLYNVFALSQYFTYCFPRKLFEISLVALLF